MDKEAKDQLTALVANYKNLLEQKESMENELFKFAKQCGAYEDMEVLEQLIVSIPFQCFVRFKLFNRYYELRDRKQEKN